MNNRIVLFLAIALLLPSALPAGTPTVTAAPERPKRDQFVQMTFSGNYLLGEGVVQDHYVLFGPQLNLGYGFGWGRTTAFIPQVSYSKRSLNGHAKQAPVNEYMFDRNIQRFAFLGELEQWLVRRGSPFNFVFGFGLGYLHQTAPSSEKSDYGTPRMVRDVTNPFAEPLDSYLVVFGMGFDLDLGSGLALNLPGRFQHYRWNSRSYMENVISLGMRYSLP